MSFEGSFHYKQILLPCHRKAGKEPNLNRLETIAQEELPSNTPLPSGWCPLISASPGAAPGPVHPADCPWEALCLQLALAAMASLSLTVGC